MKKYTIIFLSLFIATSFSCSRELTCADFKSGNFYMPVSDYPPEYSLIIIDSLDSEPVQVKLERDSLTKKYVIKRNDSSQIEWVNEVGNGEPFYETIEWINDCTYRIKYDESKMEVVEQDNPITIEKIKIKNRCMDYKATMTSNEGHKIIQFGIICKE